MTHHDWGDDQSILNDLSYALRDAALAGTIAECGRGAWAWHTLDQDMLLASLSFDSSLEQVEARRSDTDDGRRFLVFSAAPLSLELDVMPDRVIGQILPPGPGQIRVETADGVTFHVEANDVGFFDLPHQLLGTVRLRCDTPAARLVTAWVRV
jgi:hypothetical protein